MLKGYGDIWAEEEERRWDEWNKWLRENEGKTYMAEDFLPLDPEDVGDRYGEELDEDDMMEIVKEHIGYYPETVKWDNRFKGIDYTAEREVV